MSTQYDIFVYMKLCDYWTLCVYLRNVVTYCIIKILLATVSIFILYLVCYVWKL